MAFKIFRRGRTGAPKRAHPHSPFFLVQHAGCRLTQDPGAAPKLSLSLGAAPEDLGQDLEKA